MPDMPQTASPDSDQDSGSGEDEASEMYSIEVPDGLTLNPGDTLTVKSVADGMAQVECEHAGDDQNESSETPSYDDFLKYMSPKTDGENQQPPSMK